MSWALKRASAVFAVSDPLARLACELGARQQAVRTVGNGVDTALCQAACAAVRPACRDSYTIVSAGRLTPRKGHQDVIRAVAGLRLQGVAARLRIIGEAGRGVRSHEPQLRKLADDLGVAREVEFAGWMPQKLLAAAMAEADVVCLASEREGWPNVIHEALACGTPVVGYCVGSMPMLVPDERYGFVVPVGDAEALQSALEQALRKPWDRSAIAAWGRSRTWDVVAREVLLVLNQIAGSPGAVQRAN